MKTFLLSCLAAGLLTSLTGCASSEPASTTTTTTTEQTTYTPPPTR